MFFKRIFASLLAICFIVCIVPTVSAESPTVFTVNSINDTRWENHLCVYRGVATTGQNEWGDNVIVDSNGIVIGKIPSGDLRGIDLAVPNGGFIVTGNGDAGVKIYNAAKLGNKCIFDEAAMTVCFVKVEPKMFYVNSINGTRWADYICIYRNIATTGQNEWGYNLIIDSTDTVIKKIPAGDKQGADLAIPDGCFIVSGTGDIGQALYNSADIGDKCLFDDYSMRVYFAKGAVDPFYQKDIRITGYNAERYANEVIVYNRSGENTKTNVFGYEVCVGADGYILSAGGNNNVVPQGGYVISAVESEDVNILKMYFCVGAKCVLNSNSATATYTEAELTKTAESELDIAKSKLQAAKSQYKLINYNLLETKLAEIKCDGITTVQERNAVISKIRELDPMFVESRSVETRAVWYTALETTKEEIKAVVAEIKEAGFNELVLSTDSGDGTIIPIDTQKIPFKRSPVADKLDVLQVYIDECRANDISIIVLTPVMSNTYAIQNTAWLDVTNTGEERSEKFISPANSEYRKAYMNFLTYVITNYDVDGVQLDFIRYPQFYGGIDSGYDEATIALFEEKTGLSENVVREIGQQLTAHPKWSVWRNFKTELINSWVKDAYDLIRASRPDLYITAAVACYAGPTDYFQNPADWFAGEYIDGVYVMSYTEEINEETVSMHLKNRNDKGYLVMGCGAYLSISNKSLIEQTDNSDIYGADGTGYFEWGAVKSHGYTELLKNSLFKNDALPFTSDIKTVVDLLVATAKERVALYCNYNGDKASSLEAIMAALPDKNADKAAITTAIDAISAEIHENEKEYLTADLNAALRAINMAREDDSSNENNPETPTQPENPSGPFPPKDNEDTDSGNNGGDNSGNNDGGNPVDPPKEEVIKGDVNASGEIDSMDYVLVKRAYFGTFNFNEEQLAIGDVNKSGEIDSMDYVLIKRAYFGTFSFQ